MWETVGLYITLFLMAATPWLELILVIPGGIVLGLNPVAVILVAFVGNALPVLGIVAFFDWLGRQGWFRRWFRVSEQQSESEQQESSRQRKKRERAARLFRKYGVPGLAFLGPLIIGSHFAAALAMAFRAGKRTVGGWMMISLAFWSAVLASLALAGVQWLPTAIPQ
ncbi:small multidrug efflux protein - like protein [Fischerella thermalis CCMEE 5273]|nr:small multidrug efflux protein - like protein [Fischerella thermalis CCMEE 5273]